MAFFIQKELFCDSLETFAFQVLTNLRKYSIFTVIYDLSLSLLTRYFLTERSIY